MPTRRLNAQFYIGFSCAALLVSLTLVGCGDDGALSSAADAENAAVDIVGGQASEAKRVDFDGIDAWEVDVKMPNGATLELKLQQSDSTLLEIEDKVGPFDYASLMPLSGHLSYDKARQQAQDTVAGEQVAWEIKRMVDQGDRYRYEFYVRDVDTLLWEIKFWADDGEAISKELKAAID